MTTGRSITPAERFGVWKASYGRCWRCAEPIFFRDCQIDHALPLKAADRPGGVDELRRYYGLPPSFELDGFQNWVPSCQRCNLTKRDLLIDLSPATIVLLTQIRSRASLAEEIAAAIVRDAKKTPLLAKVASAVEVGDLTRNDIEQLLSGIPLSEERLKIAPNWEIAERIGGRSVMRIGLSIQYFTAGILATSDQRQVNKQLAAGLEELSAQIDDVRQRVANVEQVAHQHPEQASRGQEMSFYERARKGSDVHTARDIDGGLQLAPIDRTREAIERFQVIAREAFEHEGDGYAIILPHKSSMYPGDLYDSLILQLMD